MDVSDGSIARPPSPGAPPGLAAFIEPLVNILAAGADAHTRMQAAAVLCHLGNCRLAGSHPEALAEQMIRSGCLTLLRTLYETGDEAARPVCLATLETLTRSLTPNSRRIVMPDTRQSQQHHARMRRPSLLGAGAARVALPRPGSPALA